MGLVTGSGGVLKTADIKEEIDSLSPGETVTIKDDEYTLQGHDDLSAVDITISGQTNKDNLLIKVTGPNYFLIGNDKPSDHMTFCNMTVQSATPTSEAHAFRLGTKYAARNKDFYIHDIDLLRFGCCSGASGAIWTRGKNNGLIDSVILENYEQRQGDHYGMQLDGDNVYTTDLRKYLDPATAFDNLIVIQNCKSYYTRHFFAGDRGVAILARNNECYHGIVGQQFDAHGGWSDVNYSTVLEIICNNKIYSPDSGNAKAMAIRGGAAIIHDNWVEGYSNMLELLIEGNLTSKDIAMLCLIHDTFIWNNTGVTRVATYGAPNAEAYTKLGLDANKFIKENQNYFLKAPPTSFYTPLGEHPLKGGEPIPPDPEPPDIITEPTGPTGPKGSTGPTGPSGLGFSPKPFKIYLSGIIHGELSYDFEKGMSGSIQTNIMITPTEPE